MLIMQVPPDSAQVATPSVKLTLPRGVFAPLVWSYTVTVHVMGTLTVPVAGQPIAVLVGRRFTVTVVEPWLPV